MEVDGGGWNRVEVGARFSNTRYKKTSQSEDINNMYNEFLLQ